MNGIYQRLIESFFNLKPRLLNHLEQHSAFNPEFAQEFIRCAKQLAMLTDNTTRLITLIVRASDNLSQLLMQLRSNINASSRRNYLKQEIKIELNWIESVINRELNVQI